MICLEEEPHYRLELNLCRVQVFIVGHSDLHEVGRVPPSELLKAHVVNIGKIVVVPRGGKEVNGVPHYGEVERSTTEDFLGRDVVPSNGQKL